MDKRIGLLTGLLLSVSLLATAQNKLRPEDVQTFTLKNGMKFLVLEDHSIPNANFYTFWKVGSRNESFDPELFSIYAIAAKNVSAERLEKAIENQIDKRRAKRRSRIAGLYAPAE